MFSTASYWPPMRLSRGRTFRGPLLPFGGERRNLAVGRIDDERGAEAAGEGRLTAIEAELGEVVVHVGHGAGFGLFGFPLGGALFDGQRLLEAYRTPWSRWPAAPAGRRWSWSRTPEGRAGRRRSWAARTVWTLHWWRRQRRTVRALRSAPGSRQEPRRQGRPDRRRRFEGVSWRASHWLQGSLGSRLLLKPKAESPKSATSSSNVRTSGPRRTRRSGTRRAARWLRRAGTAACSSSTAA